MLPLSIGLWPTPANPRRAAVTPSHKPQQSPTNATPGTLWPAPPTRHGNQSLREDIVQYVYPRRRNYISITNNQIIESTTVINMGNIATFI